MNVLIEAPERRGERPPAWHRKVALSMQNQSTRCSITECIRTAYCRGWCKMHYVRWQRTGDPLTRRWDGWPDAMTRFWAKVDKSGDCWLWMGTRTKGGYGQFAHTHGQVPKYVHRISYESLIGPIPAGLQLDHLCRNRACVKPSHLEPVTPAENIRRGETGKWQQHDS